MEMALVEFCCDPNGGDFVYRVNVVGEMLPSFSFLQLLDCVLAITWPHTSELSDSSCWIN